MPGPYISAISYVLGELLPISELPELAQDPVMLQSFRALGLERYSRERRAAYELAEVAARGTLRKSGLAPSEVDLLVYASDTPPMKRYYGADIRRLCAELGIVKAYPVGLFLSECANAQVALRIASDWIAGGRASAALVVSADTGVDGYSRVWPHVTVLSDGGSAFLLTRDKPAEGFELIDTAHFTNPDVATLDTSTQMLEYFRGIVAGVRAVTKDVLARSRLSQTDVRKVIVNNYNLSVIRTYVSQMGFDLSQVYTKNLPRFAHTYASDAFINLHDAAAEQWFAPNDMVIALGTATVTWGASVLRRL
jgi:3-oxoacyl-[acyl-carrier-protein] synthase III